MFSPLSDNARLVLILIAISLTFVMLAGIVFAGFEYWWRGTPPYSLRQIGRAIETHDLELFRKYVDMHSAA